MRKGPSGGDPLVYNCMLSTAATVVWALSSPNSCSITEQQSAFPTLGNECVADYGINSWAWSADLYNAGSDSWLMVCDEYRRVWEVPRALRTKAFYNCEEGESDGNIFCPEKPSWVTASTLHNAITGFRTTIDTLCDYSRGGFGYNYICLNAMNEGRYVARRCTSSYDICPAPFGLNQEDIEEDGLCPPWTVYIKTFIGT